MNHLRRFVLHSMLPLLLALNLRADAPAIAASAEAAHPLPVGEKAPAPTLTNLEGAAIDLGTLFAAKPTVLVFYRGSWCPFCNRQLAALGELEPQLIALGYQVVAISPDTADGLKAMAGKNHLNFTLLSDHEMKAALAYGVAFRLPKAIEEAYLKHGIALTPVPGGEGYWLPVPTVYLIGRDGVIRYAYSNSNYKVRLSSADLLAAAEKLAK